MALLFGAGASAFVVPARAANINVTNSLELVTALNTAAAGDSITFTQNITLASALPQLTKDVTINGGGFELNGANKYRGFVVQSGAVAINNLNIANTLAQGGNGGFGTGGGGAGGGGAGLGGGLFVGPSAKVTVTDVTFKSNQAIGGSGANCGRRQRGRRWRRRHVRKREPDV